MKRHFTPEIEGVYKMFLNVSFMKSDILVHINELKCDLSAKELCGMYYFLFQLMNARESNTTCKRMQVVRQGPRFYVLNKMLENLITNC